MRRPRARHWCVRASWRVPEHDRGRDQIEPACTIPLLLETLIADFVEPVEEHRSGECIMGLAIVHPGMNPPEEFLTLQPVENEQLRSMRPSSQRATANPFWRG